MTKSELLGKTSSYEMTEWIALYILEGEEREAAEWERKSQARR